MKGEAYSIVLGVCRRSLEFLRRFDDGRTMIRVAGWGRKNGGFRFTIIKDGLNNLVTKKLLVSM